MTGTANDKTRIPDGWQLVRLGDVAEVNPRRPPLRVPAETPVTFLPMSAVAENCSGILARDVRPYSEVAKGYTYFFFFYSADWVEPPHVHVRRDRHTAKFWLDPVSLASSGGMRSTEVSRVQRMVEENQASFLRDWNAHFSN